MRCFNYSVNERITQRIAKQLGVSNLTEVLADELSGADLHSLLLGVLKRRISRMTGSQLTAASSVTKACDLDARLLNRVESTAYEAANNFEAVELSPVNALGTVAVLTGLDQANVLSTVRAFECSADPTVAFAVECARRRKNPADRKHIMRMCTNQRVVRFPLPTNPAYTAHFKLFAMVSAGRDTGSFAFECESLSEQIAVYLSLLSKLAAFNFRFEDITVELSDTRLVAHFCSLFNIDRDAIRASVRARDSATSAKILEPYSGKWPRSIDTLEELQQFNPPKHLTMQLSLLQNTVSKAMAEHGKARLQFNWHRLTGLGYYDGPCFHIKVKNAAGQEFALADGGIVTWTQQLLGDSKERLMTSAIGTELLCRMFRTPTTV